MNFFNRKQKSDNRNFNLKESMLQQKMEVYERFIGHFLHEINNPLREVREQLTNILYGAHLVDEQTRKNIERLERNLNRINALHVLLHEFGQQQIDTSLNQSQEHCNLNHLVERAIHISKTRSGNRPISFEFYYSNNCRILCYKNEITHSISQIINNSLEAINEQNKSGKIIVTTKQFADDNGYKYSSLEIFNNGEPISPNIQSHIFEPGFTTKNNASGMGLSVAKKLIENNGGIIEFESPAHSQELITANGDTTLFRIIFKDRI